jgi:diguanylate cyclase (GGDEF)-like protein
LVSLIYDPVAERTPAGPTDLDAIQRSPLFTGVAPALVRDALSHCVCVGVPQGHTLLAPGDRNTSLYLVVEGRLLVYLEDPGGRHYLALDVGECAGELSFIDGRAASAHVVASIPSRVLEIAHADVMRLVDGASSFARNLLQVMSSRVRNDNTHLQRSFHLQREYERAAKTDLLTGVHNRRWMDEMFPRQVARSQRSGQPLAVLMVDIDRFKRLNDTYGHQLGDVVLKATARKLAETLRPTDFLVRYGGEEFIAMLPGAAQDQAAVAAERLRIAVERTDFAAPEPGTMLKVTVSIGVAVLANGETLEQLIERADNALYRAKAAGRNTVVTTSQERS